MKGKSEAIPAGLSTKMRIVSALDELVGEKDYEKIHVSEICERAGVSRSTFYHHFEDKNAILQWHSVIAYKAGIDEIGRTLNWVQGHMVTSQFLSRYTNLYRDSGRGRDYGNVRQFFTRYRAETLRETVTDYIGAELTDEIEFQIKATAVLEAAMADERYNDKIELDIETYCRRLVRCIPRELYELTNNVPEQSGDDLTLAIMLDAFFKL